MTERISLTESYDNKDVITQIFRMADVVEKGTYKDLVVSRDGNNIEFIFTTNDDQVRTYSVPDAGITNVSGSSQGSQVTITFTMTDGTTRSFTYTATGGVTIDTDQTISGMKVFSAETTQFTHEVDIGGVLNVADTAEVNSLEVHTTATVDGNLEVGGDAKITGKLTDDVVIASTHDLEFEGAGAIEPSNSDLVISPAGRLLVKTSNGQDLEMVVSSSGVITDTPAVNDSSGRVQTTAGTDAKLDAYAPMVRTTGNQVIGGIKTLNVKPVLKRIYVRNDSFPSNWVRICSFAANASYGDMHMITRFMSGNTERAQGSMNFCVDIMQRIQSALNRNGISLLDNACQVKPLAIGVAPVIGSSVGLKMISDSDSGTVEIWGCFAQARVIVEVDAFVRINNLPVGTGVVFADDVATGIDDKTVLDAIVTWDLQTVSSTEPVGARTNNYILRGQEVTQ